MEKLFCFSCEDELTAENTSSYEGFDSSGYLVANRIAKIGKDMFIKCDPCFDADIDNYLENLQS
jgi:hypothetical protein